MGANGLKDKTAEHKAAVCELLFADGCAAKLSAAVNELPEPAPKSMLTKVNDTVHHMKYMYMMYKLNRRGTPASSYSMYVAQKA